MRGGIWAHGKFVFVHSLTILPRLANIGKPGAFNSRMMGCNIYLCGLKKNLSDLSLSLASTESSASSLLVVLHSLSLSKSGMKAHGEPEPDP